MEPNIEKLKQQINPNTLRVPEGYFDALEASIKDRLNTEATADLVKHNKPTIIRKLIIVTAIAATVTAIFLSVNLFLQNRTNNVLNIALANMSDNDLDAFMNTQLAALSPDDIYGYLNENIGQVNAVEILNNSFSGNEQIDASITDNLQEQVLDTDVLKAVMQSDEGSTEGKLLESVDEELLEEYFNNAMLFDHLGL